MLRVFRDSDREWWLERQGLGVVPIRWRKGKERARELNELEPEVADRLAKLLFAEPGTHLPNVGTRVDTDTFWVISEDK